VDRGDGTNSERRPLTIRDYVWDVKKAGGKGGGPAKGTSPFKMPGTSRKPSGELASNPCKRKGMGTITGHHGILLKVVKWKKGMIHKHERETEGKNIKAHKSR